MQKINFAEKAEKEGEEMEIKKEMKVVVVDDNPSGLDLLKIALSQFLGLKEENIFQAENGQIALEIIKNNQIDLIVSDYQMPVMDGLELFSWVRENSDQKIKDIDFLLVTGVCGQEKEEVKKIIERSGPGSGFLARPFGASDLIEKILLL